MLFKALFKASFELLSPYIASNKPLFRIMTFNMATDDNAMFNNVSAEQIVMINFCYTRNTCPLVYSHTLSD